jgi:arsenite-transporting ATPase
VLTDEETSSVRLVVNPERMVIAEAQRTFTYLNLFGYRVDAIVANRLLPDEVSDPYFDRWKEAQAGHLQTIYESFAPIPILKAHLRDRELSGASSLAELGEEIYGDVDAGDVLFVDDPMSITKDGDAYRLSLRLPFTEKGDLELSTKGDELFVKVGSYRRTIMLPNVLLSRSVTKADLRDERLEVVFERVKATP